jgi:putative membrane protein
VAVQFLDDAARSAFKRAIETVEAASAVEVVVAVRRRSAAYRHANVVLGAVVAFLGLATMLYASHTFQLSSILVDPFVVGILAGATVELLPQVKRWLTPRATRRDHVARAARATFVDRGVHDTADRSGILVYISWLEREVTLVVDSGLARALPVGFVESTETALTRAMPKGGAEVARMVEALAAAFGKAMPRRHDDVNELPNAIDSDLERSRS